jgi:hypothetical protein
VKYMRLNSKQQFGKNVKRSKACISSNLSGKIWDVPVIL